MYSLRLDYYLVSVMELLYNLTPSVSNTTNKNMPIKNVFKTLFEMSNVLEIYNYSLIKGRTETAHPPKKI